MASGGAREGAGRPKRTDEQELIEKLKKYDDIVIAKIIEGASANKFNYIKLFCEYRFGKPRQQLDVTTNNESLNRIMVVPEAIATQLLNDIPDGSKPDNLDNSEQENKQITE